HFQRLLERQVNLARLSLLRPFGKEYLHDQTLVILVQPGPLWLAGFAPVIIVPGRLIIGWQPRRIIRSSPRCLSFRRESVSHHFELRCDDAGSESGPVLTGEGAFH